MNYVNDSFDISLGANETICYGVDSDAWGGWHAYCPEFYVYNDGHREGLSFCGFKQGTPYFFNLSTETTYMIFFGVQTNQCIRLCFNESPQTEKRWQAISLDSKNLTSSLTATKYEGENILTSDNQTSNLPIPCFEFKENMLKAAFRRSTVNGGTLQTGAQLRGVWIEVNLVRDQDPAIQPTYSQFSKASAFFMTSESSIK